MSITQNFLQFDDDGEVSFGESTTFSPDDIDAYLVDIQKYLKDNPTKNIAPNEELFSKETLSQRPGMEWLSSVECHLIAPSTRNPEEQQTELDSFFDRIKSTAMFLPADFCSALSNSGFPGGKFIALDTETTGLDTRVLYDHEGKLTPKTKIVGFSVATSETVGYYLPVLHTEEDGVFNWDYAIAVKFLQRIVDEFLCIFHNAQYDKEVLSLSGVKTRGFPYFMDTLSLHFMSDVNEKSHGLKRISEVMLGRKMIEISQLFTEMGVKTKGHINFDKLPVTNSTIYACSDAINTMGCFLQFAQMPPEDNVFIQQPIPISIDHKLIDTLRNLYRPGFPVNIDFAIRSCKDILNRLHILRKEMYLAVGKEFDIQSPQQVSVILFDDFKIPPLEKMERGKPTKTYPQGLYSTDADTLEALLEKHPDILLLQYIVQYRQLCLSLKNVFSKLIANSYVDALLPYTRSKAQYSITVIPTGRLSSSSNDGREGIIVNTTKAGKVIQKHHKGSWDAGINTQGIPKPDKKTEKAKRILSLPEEAGLNFSDPYGKEITLDFVKQIAGV